MKLTTSLLRSKATGPLPSLEYLDLSKLGLVTIDKLSACPKLQTLKLCGNYICEATNFECCSQLWHLDLSNNKVQCLDGLSKFLAFGTLVLSNNDLIWKELTKIRHIHILNLSLHGNSQLEKDPYYRLHVIDCLPNVWMLDGRIITAAERLQVKHFFHESALTDHPVRHKLGREWFIPSALKKIQVTGIFGEKAKHLLTKFPVNAVHNIEIDQRRLKYLAYTLQEDLIIERKYTQRVLQVLQYRRTFLEDLLEVRPHDRERCNMLLLLLVASLEFVMPTHLVKETLDVAMLSKIGKVYTMDLFLLPKDVRCQVVSLLLSAIKVDKDIHEDGGLYDRLYLCLFYKVAELTRISHSDGYKHSEVLVKMQKLHRDYKCLLASEIVQLMCIVPAFFEYVEKDVGVMNLVTAGTGDRSVIGNVTQLARSYAAEGKDVRKLYEEISDMLLQKVQEQTMNLSNKSPNEAIAETILSSCPSGNKPKTPVEVSDYHMKGMPSPDNDPPVIQTHTPRKQASRFPHLGDVLLLGPQTLGKVISLPQPFLALVAMDAIPVSNGSMEVKLKDADEHYTYVNMNELEWEEQYKLWKPKGTVGDRYTLQSVEDMKEELERKAALVDHTTRPNSPSDWIMYEPPAREPTPLIYMSQRSQTSIGTAKLKSVRTPRPMSSVLKEKLDLKLDLSRRAKSARVLGNKQTQSRQTRVAGKLLMSQAAIDSRRHSEFNKAHQQRKKVAMVKEMVEDIVNSALDNAAQSEVQQRLTENHGQVQQELALYKLSNCRTDNQKSDVPNSPDSPRAHFLTKVDNSDRPESGLSAPARLDFDIPTAKSGDSEPSTGRETGRRMQGRLMRGMTERVKKPSGPKPSEPRSSRPFSAVDAYRYFVTTRPSTQSENLYNTDFQRARMEVWKKQVVETSSVKAKQTPPQRPTSPAGEERCSSVSPLHIHRANTWLGGGRDLYWEAQQKRPKSGHTPGWKEGLPDNMKIRPKSAVASRTLKRSKTPIVVTPSSIAYEAMLAGYTTQDLPLLPQLSDYQPLTYHLGLPRRLGSPPPGVDDFYTEPIQDTVYR